MQTNNKADEKQAEVKVDLNVEELEEVIAPGAKLNHNETVTDSDEVTLDVEELEEVVAPAGIGKGAW